MRRPDKSPLLLHALCIICLLTPIAAAAESRPTLGLQGLGSVFGCAEISGHFVLLLDAQRATLLSATEFPGGRRVGRIAAGRLALEQPIGGQAGLQTDGNLPDGTTIFGWRVPGVETHGKTGCIAFEQSRFTWPGDLASYVRWLVRDLYLPVAERGWLASKALHVGSRSIRMEIQPVGYRTVTLSSVEAGLTGLDLPNGERYFFRPVLLGDTSHAAVLVTHGKGKVYSADGQELMALVQIRTDAPTHTATDPDFAIRLAGLGD